MITKPENFNQKKKKKKKRNLWTEEETRKLEEAFKIYEKKDFKSISNYIQTRTVAQVRSKLQKLERKNYKNKRNLINK